MHVCPTPGPLAPGNRLYDARTCHHPALGSHRRARRRDRQVGGTVDRHAKRRVDTSGYGAPHPDAEGRHQIGGSETDQHAISTGTIDDDKVVIVARHAENGREYRLELKLQDEELNGTVTVGERRAEVRTKRRKE